MPLQEQTPPRPTTIPPPLSGTGGTPREILNFPVVMTDGVWASSFTSPLTTEVPAAAGKQRSLSHFRKPRGYLHHRQPSLQKPEGHTLHHWILSLIVDSWCIFVSNELLVKQCPSGGGCCLFSLALMQHLLTFRDNGGVQLSTTETKPYSGTELTPGHFRSSSASSPLWAQLVGVVGEQFTCAENTWLHRFTCTAATKSPLLHPLKQTPSIQFRSAGGVHV